MNSETRNGKLNPTLGIVLVALGGLALLSQMGLFRGLGSVLGALLFGAIGFYLIRNQYRGRGEVWALCVGFALLGLGAASIAGPMGGTAFLGLTGAGFLVAYRDDRERWWAVIPGGVLLTLALVAGLDSFASPLGGGPIFFLGLAAVFWYLYRHPNQEKRWAVYPAVALTVLALLTLSFSGGWVLPVALIVAGLYFLNREQGRRIDWRETAESVNSQVDKWLTAGERAVREVVTKPGDPERPAAKPEAVAEDPAPRDAAEAAAAPEASVGGAAPADRPEEKAF
ncbi:MAG TPA: hypothetical protein VF168_06445 [Trueperaceae bacterium]